jgi:hypothetical protein
VGGKKDTEVRFWCTASPAFIRAWRRTLPRVAFCAPCPTTAAAPSAALPVTTVRCRKRYVAPARRSGSDAEWLGGRGAALRRDTAPAACPVSLQIGDRPGHRHPAAPRPLGARRRRRDRPFRAWARFPPPPHGNPYPCAVHHSAARAALSCAHGSRSTRRCRSKQDVARHARDEQGESGAPAARSIACDPSPTCLSRYRPAAYQPCASDHDRPIRLFLNALSPCRTISLPRATSHRLN